MAIDLSRLSVLIVDQSAPMRSLVKQILYSFRIRSIVECSNGAQALKELKHFHADVLITDWMMEPVNGLNLTREIRAGDESGNQYLPIIMLSGHTELESVMEARDAGINEFVAKPVSVSALLSRLMLIIENPRPFVRTEEYFGPSRRRKKSGPPKGRTPLRSDDAQANGAVAMTRATNQSDFEITQNSQAG